MTTHDKEDLVSQFKTEVDDLGKEIDPSNEQDWFSLTLGWAIGKGLNIEDAHDFAIFIRYETDLG